MSTKDKLIERFKTLPSDFTFDELVRLLAHLGFIPIRNGVTSGSRVHFVRGKISLKIHRPHPGNIVKEGPLKSVYECLKQNNLV